MWILVVALLIGGEVDVKLAGPFPTREVCIVALNSMSRDVWGDLLESTGQITTFVGCIQSTRQERF